MKKCFNDATHKTSKKGLLFAIIALSMLLPFVACKDPNGGGNTIEKVTIGVLHDSNVKEVATTITVDKGMSLGFSLLKDKLKAKFKDGYELKSIHLGGKDGKIISDSVPHTFNENVNIYLASKAIGTNEELKLVSLKVDGSPVQIGDVMDLGKTLKEKISVEASATPSDAEVLFEPSLENGIWNLGSKGVHTLKITAKKDSDKKDYTVNIEKLEEGTPIIKKVTVAEETRNENKIESTMTFIAPHGVSSVEVSIETEPANASKFFNSNKSEDGKFTLNLQEEETILTISVGDAPKSTEYSVKVKKSVLPSSLVDAISVVPTSTIKGEFLLVDPLEMQKVLDGDKSVKAMMDGREALISIMSITKKWSSCKINGKVYDVIHTEDLASQVLFPILIDKKGDEKEIAVEIESEGKFAFLFFCLKRSNNTVDLPITNLFIDGENQVSELEILTKLYDEANINEPEFIAVEGATLEVQCPLEQIKNATIDGTVCNAEKKQDNEGNDVWACSSDITGIKPQGKNVSINVIPIDAETYHETKWTFHLAYKAPSQIEVEYEFNGMNEYGLPAEFVEGLEANLEPTLQVKGTHLNIRLICKAEVKEIKLNDLSYKENDITDIGDGTFGIKGRMELDGVNATPITITITPKDDGAYSPKILKFKAQGDGILEEIKPTLIEISKDKNLPQATFLDKIADGTTNPLHKVHGNSADILAYINTYEYEFLCKEVKVNGNKVNVEPSDFANQWQITPSIPVTQDSSTNVVIEFIGYEGISKGVTWKFCVKGGGALPGVPREYVNILKINEKGTDKNPLPEEFIEHLIDGVNPEHIFDGKKVTVSVGTGMQNLISKVTFKVDSEQGVDVQIKKEGDYVYAAKHIFENIADGASHPVELTIHPVDTAKYSPLKLAFKLKWSGKKSPLPLVVGVNAVKRDNGWKGTIAGEKATLLVQTRTNVMKEVWIGVKDSEVKCNIRSFSGSDGRTRWQADREVDLLVNNEVVEQTFSIKIIPLDESEYEEARYEYTLTGTKIPATNAEFVWTGDQGSVPYLTHNIEWVDNTIAMQYSDMYGVKSDTITVKTVSPRASVKYQIVNPLTGKPIEGQSEREMTNDPSNKGTHSAKVVMLPNQPTHLRLWVVAEDGRTKNNSKGAIAIAFNTAQLAWSYENESEGKNFRNNAYSVIEIDRNEVNATDKKIYLAFSIYDEKYGYSVLNTDLPSYQTDFEKLDTLGKDFQSYKTSIDVSSLLDNNQNELEAMVKVQKNNILCFTYKVKIKLKG